MCYNNNNNSLVSQPGTTTPSHQHPVDVPLQEPDPNHHAIKTQIVRMSVRRRRRRERGRRNDHHHAPPSFLDPSRTASAMEKRPPPSQSLLVRIKPHSKFPCSAAPPPRAAVLGDFRRIRTLTPKSKTLAPGSISRTQKM